ncbi:MAG: ABC transporter substrate binding protein [Eubacteriales bacterium]
MVQHEALDAATQGFKDAVEEGLGKDNVTFEEQNASGDSATCATMINQFVSDNVDLIWRTPHRPCRRQHREPIPFRYWEPLLQSMA